MSAKSSKQSARRGQAPANVDGRRARLSARRSLACPPGAAQPVSGELGSGVHAALQGRRITGLRAEGGSGRSQTANRVAGIRRKRESGESGKLDSERRPPCLRGLPRLTTSYPYRTAEPSTMTTTCSRFAGTAISGRRMKRRAGVNGVMYVTSVGRGGSRI